MLFAFNREGKEFLDPLALPDREVFLVPLVQTVLMAYLEIPDQEVLSVLPVVLAPQVSPVLKVPRVTRVSL